MSGLLRLPLSRVVLLDSSPCSIDGKEQALFPQSSLTSTQGYPLNFLCSPPALNERLGRRRSSASSLSQNSLYVNDGRPFWQYIVSSSTGCSDSQCFEELYNYYTTDKAWHLCDPDAEKVVEALRKAGVKVEHLSALGSFDRRMKAAKGKRMVVFLDYDETLSPIVDDLDHAFMSDEMRAAVREVAKYFPTTVISGMSRDKVMMSTVEEMKMSFEREMKMSFKKERDRQMQAMSAGH